MDLVVQDLNNSMKSKQCKIEGCNNPVWGDGLCANHKPRKQLMSNGKPMRKVKLSGVAKEIYDEMMADRIKEMREFFLQIWKKRLHLSEVSGLPLVGEPLSVYFHHILPK
jgi:hypothetical protein